MYQQNSREASLFVVPVVQLIVGLLLFVALLHGQTTLIITTVLILVFTIIARIWSRLSFSALTCFTVVDKDRLFPREIFKVELRVKNSKILPVWLQASPVSSDGLIFSSEGAPSEKKSGLLGYQGAYFKWEMAALKRGVYQIGPLRVRVGDYLGFFIREKRNVSPLDIIVYPRLISLKNISLPRRDFFGVPGTESPVQDPVYILGTRDYQHNQPARHIHWKASARHDRLQEKIFEPTVQEKVLLALEVNQFAEQEAKDEFEDTLEVMASLAVQLDQKGYAVGLVTNGVLTGGGPSFLPVAASPMHLSSLLEILARMRMVKHSDLVNILRMGLPLPWGLTCIHFSCQQDASTHITEGYFTSRRTIPLFVVCRPPSEAFRNKHQVEHRTYSLDKLRIEQEESV